MRASSLFTFSVLAVVAPIAAAPHPLELYEIEGTSTHIFHIAPGVPQTTAFPMKKLKTCELNSPSQSVITRKGMERLVASGWKLVAGDKTVAKSVLE
ncbi:MAG: hypothetical protein LQ347_005988 [Umbilicaria vellea]|nr:MAG: hypothetical protein LQ347_005988 [Umbilicaria vellea]